MLVLMAVLPVVHLLSIASLDALSRLPFLKVRLWFIGRCGWGLLGASWRDVVARRCQTYCMYLRNRPTSTNDTGECNRPGMGLRFIFVDLRPLLSLCLACCTLRQKKLSERDRIAVMFCGSHKTLAFGIPLIKVWPVDILLSPWHLYSDAPMRGGI